MIARLYSVGFTVADMDRALEFYTKLLPFEVVSDGEYASFAYEQLAGIANARIWRLPTHILQQPM